MTDRAREAAKKLFDAGSLATRPGSQVVRSIIREAIEAETAELRRQLAASKEALAKAIAAYDKWGSIDSEADHTTKLAADLELVQSFEAIKRNVELAAQESPNA
jgi:hypothetical protein